MEEAEHVVSSEQMARSPLRPVRWLLWGLVAAALVAFAVLQLRSTANDQARATGGFTLGGPFTLTDTNGRPFSSETLRGSPYALFFGFTNCPDVCPNTLGRLAKLRKALGQGDEAFKIVFISVDPKRDTPKVIGDYLQLFGTPMIGLTGTEEQVAAVAKQHATYQKRSPDASAPPGYTVDHGAAALLFDRDGKFVSTIALEEGDKPALDKLERITA